MTYRVALVCILLLGIIALPVVAQERGQYIPGTGVFAIGPEFGVIPPTKKFNFLARVLPEFGARNRTQGVTAVFAIGKSF